MGRVSEGPGIGDRIRELRTGRRPRLTQSALAHRAGVSVDVIAKLEQGIKRTALVGTLDKIAGALDVEVGALLRHDDGPAGRPAGGRHEVPTADPGPAALAAIRRALIVPSTRPPTDLDELASSVRRGWQAYWAADRRTLVATLPELLLAARASDAAAGSARSAALLGETYGLAGSLLARLGHVDLAYLAMERAVVCAARSDDPLRRTAVVGWLAWQTLHRLGMLDPAQELAPTASGTELGAATPIDLTVWGALLLSAARTADPFERLADDPAAVGDAGGANDGTGFVALERALTTMRQVGAGSR